MYIDMLVHILRTLKIVTYTQPPFEDAKPYLVPGPGLKTWSSENAFNQTRKLLNQWKNNHNWLDVNMFSNDEYNRGVYVYGSQVLQYRQMLLDAITHMRCWSLVFNGSATQTDLGRKPSLNLANQSQTSVLSESQ